MPTQSNDERFGAAVRRRREAIGWSRGQFATNAQSAGLSNFHPTTIARVESGQQPVRLSEALVIADLLEVSIEELTSEDNRPEVIIGLEELVAQVEAAMDEAAHAVAKFDVARDRLWHAYESLARDGRNQVGGRFLDRIEALGRMTIDDVVQRGSET